MLFSIVCKQGKLQLSEDGVLRVVAPFNKLVWQVSAQDIRRIVTQLGVMMSLNIYFHTGQATYEAETVTKGNFAKVQAHFQHLGTQQPSGSKWYHDQNSLAHSETYTNQNKMQREVAEAAQFGWVPQTSSAQDGQRSVLKMAGGAVLLGPLGLILGAGKSKGKTTLTFVRSEEWKASHYSGPQKS